MAQPYLVFSMNILRVEPFYPCGKTGFSTRSKPRHWADLVSHRGFSLLQKSSWLPFNKKFCQSPRLEVCVQLSSSPLLNAARYLVWSWFFFMHIKSTAVKYAPIAMASLISLWDLFIRYWETIRRSFSRLCNFKFMTKQKVFENSAGVCLSYELK